MKRSVQNLSLVLLSMTVVPSLKAQDADQPVQETVTPSASPDENVDPQAKASDEALAAPAAEEPKATEPTAPAVEPSSPDVPSAEVLNQGESDTSRQESASTVQSPTTQSKITRHQSVQYGSDFGSFRFALGAGRPTFDEKKVKYYDDLYGKAKIHPDMNLDYYFLDWYVTLGLGLHTSYYRASGKASQVASTGSGTLDPSQIDKDSDLELVLIPMQGVVTMEITPWKGSFITLNGWTGVERMFVQETRYPSADTGGTSSTSTDTSGSSTYVNKGWNEGTIIGASASLKMDYFDRSTNSLEILGFRSVYITPYVTIAKTTKTKVAAFDRKTMGILFTFESIY